jgi:hypothetical protein
VRDYLRALLTKVAPAQADVPLLVPLCVRRMHMRSVPTNAPCRKRSAKVVQADIPAGGNRSLTIVDRVIPFWHPSLADVSLSVWAHEGWATCEVGRPWGDLIKKLRTSKLLLRETHTGVLCGRVLGHGSVWDKHVFTRARALSSHRPRARTRSVACQVWVLPAEMRQPRKDILGGPVATGRVGLGCTWATESHMCLFR